MSWTDQYRSKLVTVREAVSCVESGMRVYIHPGCAEPEALVEALMERAFRRRSEGRRPAASGVAHPDCASQVSRGIVRILRASALVST